MSTHTRMIAIALAALFLFLTVDFWKIRGQVIDEDSKRPVAHAEVLITLFGQEFESPVPHAWTASSRCVRSGSVRTDENGRFSFWSVTWGFGLNQKRVHAEAFAPGWYPQHDAGFSVGTTLISPPDNIAVKVKADRGERWSYGYHHSDLSPITTDPNSPLYQETMSKSLTEIAWIGSNTLNWCDDGRGEALAAKAWVYAMSKAQTQDEIKLVRGQCGAINKRLLTNRRGHFDERDEQFIAPGLPKACEEWLRKRQLDNGSS